jgi:hypothetical protein
MAIAPYRYAATFIAQAQGAWDIQKQNLGALELVIDKLVPGGKEILTLSLAEFTIPGRKIGVGQAHYLNGSVNYLTKPDPQGNITATFRDYPNNRTRSILELWYSKAYNEETGLMMPPSLLKATGFAVLTGENGGYQRSMRLEGVMLVNRPDIAIVYATGEALLMAVELAVDRVIPDPSFHAPSPT